MQQRAMRCGLNLIWNETSARNFSNAGTFFKFPRKLEVKTNICCARNSVDALAKRPVQNCYGTFHVSRI